MSKTFKDILASVDDQANQISREIEEDRCKNALKKFDLA